MISTSELGPVLLVAAALMAPGCGLSRPADPPPFDCDRIEDAAERFPDRCGEEPPDAGPEEEDAP